MRPSIPPGSLVVAIGPGGRTGEYIQVRTQMDAAMSLSRSLRAEGIKSSFSIQESIEVPELAALVVSIGTGLGGVAAVLSAYLRRHQDKAILVERDGTRYELKGMRPDEMERQLDRLLNQAADDQRRTEHLYRGIPGADDDADDDPRAVISCGEVTCSVEPPGQTAENTEPPTLVRSGHCSTARRHNEGNTRRLLATCLCQMGSGLHIVGRGS